MKYLLFPVVAFTLFLSSSCDNDRNEGSGIIITDDRTDGAFSAIEISHALNVTIRQGADHRVVVRGDDNLIGRVETTTSDGVLSARLGRGSFRNATISLEVTTPELDRLLLENAVSGQLIDFVSDREMTVELNDASKLELSGAAPSLRLSVNDASNLNAFAFATDNCTAEIRSASNVRLTVNDRLEGRVRDASTVRYRGTPVVDVSVSDASRVIDDN